jgi:hypothetical protein
MMGERGEIVPVGGDLRHHRPVCPRGATGRVVAVRSTVAACGSMCAQVAGLTAHQRRVRTLAGRGAPSA